jgi:bacterioferritin
MTQDMDRKQVIATLNQILEAELAGVVRYTHYSLMVMGPLRGPIVTWLEAQASESLVHAREAGEMLTQLGAHPSLGIGKLLETHQHDLDSILRESLDHERATLKQYWHLKNLVEGHSVMLEEYARTMIATEEKHCGEVDRMLRKPGDLAPIVPGLTA